MKFVIGLLAAVALLSVSCEKTKEASTKKNPYDGVKMEFTLAINKLESNSAEIRVRYTADETMSWYYCVSDDMEASIEDLVDDGVSLIDKTTTLERFKSKVIAVTELASGTPLVPETDYRFVVFGVKREDDGTIWTYGTPAEISFKTSKDLNVIFSATEPVVERNSVKFTVSYDVDEDAEYTWYAHLTKTISGTTANVIKSEIKNIPADQLKSGKDVEVTLSDLDYSTTYRIIVTGLLADGTVYGTPADVTFQTPDFFILSDAWTMAYDKKTFYTGNSNQYARWRTLLNVSKADETFDIFSVSKAEFDSEGLDALINENYNLIANIVNQYKDDAQYGSTYGSWSYWFYNAAGSFYGGYDGGPGTYVTVIYGVDPDNGYAMTGHYAKLEYTVAAGTTSSGYEAWLGDWVTDGQAWTIEEDVPGETYAIYGINNYDTVPFHASYNDGKLYFCEQMSGVEAPGFPAGNEYSIWGMFGGGYWGSIDRCVFIGTIDGNTATLTPCRINATNGNFTGFEVFISDGGDSGYYGNRVKYTLPNTMTKPSETGSEAYNKWLGDWDIIGRNVDDTADSTFFTLNVAQITADVSYALSGWGLLEGTGAYSIGHFVASSGALTIESALLAEKVKVFPDDDGLYNVGVYPRFVDPDDGNTYFSSTPGAVIATATFNGEDVVVTAGEIADGIPYIDFNLWAVAGTSGYRLWTNNLDLPFGMQAAASPSPAPIRKTGVKASVARAFKMPSYRTRQLNKALGNKKVNRNARVVTLKRESAKVVK